MELEQFKAMFINEARDLINTLEETLLNNENALNNKECINEIFRVMHTLKGVSSMYGFSSMSDLAHEIEDIFDLIREDRQEFTPELFNITLRVVDHFRNLLIDDNLANELNQKAHETLLSELNAINNKQEVTPTEEIEDIITEVADKGKETYYIIFKPDDYIFTRGIKLVRIFEDLTALGDYTIVNHTFAEHDDEFEGQNAWGIYLVTDQGLDAIEDALMFILDNCRIIRISNGSMLNAEEFLANLDQYDFDQDNITITDASVETHVPQEMENVVQDENPGKKAESEPVAVAESVVQAEEKNTKSNAAQTIIETVEHNIQRISVDASKLDQLMYLVSELVTAKSQLHLAVQQLNQVKLVEISEKIENLSRGFRENALTIRLVPVAEMITPFKRLVRDLSKEMGKEIKFITQGVETELDKNVLDRLSEPVMHILRNCVDHGIEVPEKRVANNKSPVGNIKFTSFYSGANVFIQIQDDGAGIDPEKIREKAISMNLISANDKLSDHELINLIFHPGFSTAEKITDVSGRGVGMDIVRRKIEEIRGEVEINSEKGLGTFFTIRLHQTLSIIDSLLLQVDNMYFLVPLSDIEYCDQAKHEDIYKTHNKQIEVEEGVIPYVSLRDLFGSPSKYPDKEKLVIINKNDKRIAILADKIIGDHQAVLKPLGEVFHGQQFLLGASMLGDGSLALMLDTNKLTNIAILDAAHAY